MLKGVRKRRNSSSYLSLHVTAQVLKTCPPPLLPPPPPITTTNVLFAVRCLAFPQQSKNFGTESSVRRGDSDKLMIDFVNKESFLLVDMILYASLFNSHHTHTIHFGDTYENILFFTARTVDRETVKPAVTF